MSKNDPGQNFLRALNTQATRRSRRRFLVDLGCATLGTTTVYSSLAQLGATSAVAQAPDDDYRALVCILQAGGNDSFNMLVPTSSSEYAAYAAIRQDLALAQNTLLPLADSGLPGRTFGVHPNMPEVQTLFDQGDLAFVANVGTLVEPTTLAQYESGSVKLPFGLFSHSDQIQQWQTSTPDLRGGTGFGGRLADALSELNSSNEVSMNVSVAGSNLFQNGLNTVEFAVSPSGETLALNGYDGDGFYQQLRTSAINSLVNDRYVHLFEREYANRIRSSIDSAEVFSAALASVPPIATVFSPSSISQSLHMVARTISARAALGHKRQTFFVLFGGWDHHDEVLQNQAAMLPQLSAALGEFHAATRELGVESEVTTFTISDFGRTLTSNGRGSDHGWGGNQLVMGGAVQGSRIYGDYPSLVAGNSLDTGRGRLIPTTSVDEYFAEMALWFGVAPGELDAVVPNIERFYDPSSGEPPLGFLA